MQQGAWAPERGQAAVRPMLFSGVGQVTARGMQLGQGDSLITPGEVTEAKGLLSTNRAEGLAASLAVKSLGFSQRSDPCFHPARGHRSQPGVGAVAAG